jgi:DNA-binding GntR family transcriptional regulator
VRKQLESWASRLAAERAAPEDHDEARALRDELLALQPGDDHPTLLAVDRRIHRFVYRTTRNSFLAETLDRYHNLSLRILHVAMRRYPPLTPRLEDVVHEQQGMLEAILAGDGGAAERIAHAHISTFERAIRDTI